MEVLNGLRNMLMPHQVLNGEQVGAIIVSMCAKAVTKGMKGVIFIV